MSIWARDKRSEYARSRRRMFPIHMYVGRNGAGKTMCMVYDTLPDLDSGALVLSTVRLLDYNDPRPCDDEQCSDPVHPNHGAAHPLYVPFTDWHQLLDWARVDLGAFQSAWVRSELRDDVRAVRFGPVLMDEITGVADSNSSGEMPQPVRNKLPQLRRDDIALRLTALNFIRADKRIREATKALTRCQSSMPVTNKSGDGLDKLWRPRRLAKYTTYDAESLPVDDHTAHAYDQADVLVKGRHWIPTSPARLAYDTYAPVLVVGTVTDSGRCASCGGTRRAPECGCSDYVTDRSARRAGGAGGRPRPSTAPDPEGRHSHAVRVA